MKWRSSGPGDHVPDLDMNPAMRESVSNSESGRSATLLPAFGKALLASIAPRATAVTATPSSAQNLAQTRLKVVSVTGASCFYKNVVPPLSRLPRNDKQLWPVRKQRLSADRL